MADAAMEDAPAPEARKKGGDPQNAPWVEKYRPKSLDDVIAHKDIIDTISRLTKEDRLPHLLLYGPPGTGKTSTILAVARQIYGNGYKNMTLELNASDERGIDVVRDRIQDFASTKRIFSTGFKLIILDECDAMVKDAQFALRRIIEKYTKNTRFCLICNYVSKIIPALQSRCTRFRFAPLTRECVISRLKDIIQQENVASTDAGLEAVFLLGGGDMRRSLNILQATSLAAGPGGAVDDEAVYATTGQPRPRDVELVAQWLLNDPFDSAYDKLLALQVERGLALVDIVRGLLTFVFRLNIPADVRISVVEGLADVEHRLAFVTGEKLQAGALVGCFTAARAAIVAAAR